MAVHLMYVVEFHYFKKCKRCELSNPQEPSVIGL